MSSLPKISFTRKTGTVIVGITLFGSLALTACGAPEANTASDSKSQPSASASASEAPTGITEFKSDAFDLSKQVSIPTKQEDTNILLSNGIVAQSKEDGNKISVSFTPYESKDGAWKYTTDVALTTNPKVQLMRWKDKSYLVVSGWKDTTEAASGLTAEKKTQEQHVIVLDAVTGKVVNTFKGEVFPLGGGGPDMFSFNPRSSDTTNGETAISFLTGLTYRTGSGKAKLVDPLTGSIVATESKSYGPMSLNNEAGFYTDAENESNQSTMKAMFGNFGLVVNENPTYKDKFGASLKNSTFSLVNTVTNETIASMKCLGDGADTSKKPVYSPNFRYVIFEGQYVFDTKTGKSFCTSPVGKEDMRRFKVSAMDNDGNMYGTADSDYLRVSLADNTKVETLLSKLTQTVPLPILITDKGSALFYSEGSSDVLVAVPSKAPTNE